MNSFTLVSIRATQVHEHMSIFWNFTVGWGGIGWGYCGVEGRIKVLIFFSQKKTLPYFMTPIPKE